MGCGGYHQLNHIDINKNFLLLFNTSNMADYYRGLNCKQQTKQKEKEEILSVFHMPACINKMYTVFLP